MWAARHAYNVHRKMSCYSRRNGSDVCARFSSTKMKQRNRTERWEERRKLSRVWTIIITLIIRLRARTRIELERRLLPPPLHNHNMQERTADMNIEMYWKREEKNGNKMSRLKVLWRLPYKWSRRGDRRRFQLSEPFRLHSSLRHTLAP